MRALPILLLLSTLALFPHEAHARRVVSVVGMFWFQRTQHAQHPKPIPPKIASFLLRPPTLLKTRTPPNTNGTQTKDKTSLDKSPPSPR